MQQRLLSIVILLSVIYSCSTIEKESGDNAPVPPTPAPSIETPSPAPTAPNEAPTRPNLKVGGYPLFHYDGNTDYDGAKFDVIILDGLGSDAGDLDYARTFNKPVLAYLSVGNWEKWRDEDKHLWEDCKSSANKDWPGEWWIDPSCENALKVNKARIQKIADKKFDGVYFDNTDIYNNDEKFTKTETEKYIRALADYAKSLGLYTGINNGLEMIQDFTDLDFYVNESCNRYKECHWYGPVVNKKPIYHLEYKDKYCFPVEGHSVVMFSSLSWDGFKKFCK